VTISTLLPRRAKPGSGLAVSAPVAVLDIGSNSVRLIIYERAARALTPLYNEKVPCALGRGVGESGVLATKPMKKALKAMERFALMCERNGVKTNHILATSAVRDAANGPSFAARVEAVMGHKVSVLSGTEEARYAALGAYSGMPGQKGLVGDLGGGSLEMAELNGGLRDEGETLAPGGETLVRGGETLALGAIRLQDEAGGDLGVAEKIVGAALAGSRLIEGGSQKRFIAVGGNWRAIARLHQMATGYPLHVVHNYVAPAHDVARLCATIVAERAAGQVPAGLDRFSAMRADLVPFAAVVLGAVLEKGAFEGVCFSALGVREGVLFEHLTPAVQARDPLLEAAANIGAQRARDAAHGGELMAFCDRFLRALGITETRRDNRLARAACLLSDINWRGHPDYQGEQAVALVAYGSFVGVDHGGRAQIAATLAVRHMGLSAHSASQDILDLAGAEGMVTARRTGAVLRLAFQLSGGRSGILAHLNWRVGGGELGLVLPQNIGFLASDKVKRRLGQLAGEIGLAGKIILAD
jgi:exopolyphosphatase / guanosine-5'-triphosphate,3'-diphosphate pyrophosphatase